MNWLWVILILGLAVIALIGFVAYLGNKNATE